MATTAKATKTAKVSKAAPKKGTAARTSARTEKAAAITAAGFAVIMTGGKQYRVSAGTEVKIEKIKGEMKVGDKVIFDQVLMTDNGTDAVIGAPTIKGASVTGELVEIGRHPKVIVYKYKQKSRSGTSRNGHRQPFFKVRIDSIKA